MTKDSKKNSQNRVFGLFKKVKSSVLFGSGVKQKLLWVINILKKLHAWEESNP